MTISTTLSSPASKGLCRSSVATRYVHSVGKAADWLREERRKTLGDWVAACVECGHAQRYFDEYESELPSECPHCAGELRSRCPDCNARFSSAFAVECEACGSALRPAEQFGVRIRKPGK
jgi:ribosomal protein S27E